MTGLSKKKGGEALHGKQFAALRRTSDTLPTLHRAADALLLAYAKNDGGMGSVDWNDVDDAFRLAKLALPGRYAEWVSGLKSRGDE